MITDAIVPVAGLGTRLLPATRSQPKEMLPLIDKPVVQYVVEELADGGIERILFVTGAHKRAIEDHFDHPDVGVKILYTRQPQPAGLGDAIRCADGFANDGVVVALGDGVIDPPGIVPRLIAAFESERPDVALAVAPIADEEVSRRGIVVIEDDAVTDLLEKPEAKETSSRTAMMGRYVLGPTVFEALRDLGPDASGEVQLTDALRRVLLGGGRIVAVSLAAGQRRHDIGSPEGYSSAFLEYGLLHPTLGPGLRALAAGLLDERP
ncbi:MAG TPA: sugar phosphate nucleotidyltransferase [Solirubrobacteraceae bacterium]